MSIYLTIFICIYLLIGMFLAYSNLKITEEAIKKYDNDEILTEEENMIVDKVRKVNQTVPSGVSIMVISVTLFWLPMMIFKTA